MKQFILIIMAAAALKLLFIFGYRSTDFEVHRNWKALTYSLPVSQWYYESTSEWTLDYPPLFAWFEFVLAQFGAYFDPKLCTISREPYASLRVIYFLRSTVILSEMLLFFALWKLYTALSSSNATIVMKRRFVPTALLLAFNYGLILIDHIHFQYNGFLFGILLLSVSFLAEKRFVAASVTFTILLNMKHIFMYVAPVYFIYILVAYCLEKPDPLEFFRRLFKVGLAVLAVTLISFGPFIYMNQLQQIWIRLFPFGRGLCHAYWAPNTWALYNTMDKLLILLNSRYNFAPGVSSAVASMTGGIVGEIQHAILPNIRPLHTALLAFFGMMPSLIQCAVKSYSISKNSAAIGYVQFLIGLTAAAWSSFLFGWHVHEKAVLMVLIPLNLLAMAVPKYRYVAFYATTLGHYSLMPLIHTSAEAPAVVSMFLAYTTIHWLILFRLHPAKVEANKPKSKPAEVGPICFCLGRMHLCGLALLFLCTRVIYPWSEYHDRLPFLPLMATSAYTALGLCFAFPYFVALSFSKDRTGTVQTTPQPTAKGDRQKKVKVQ